MSSFVSQRQRRKQAALAHLQAPDWDGLLRWAHDETSAEGTLVSLLLADDPLIRWRALEGLGRLAADTAARGDEDAVRDLVRRQLWSMNDESGGVAWHAPEAVGEILARVPALAEEFAVILLSYAEIDPYGPGTLWAMARLAPRYPLLLANEAPRIAAALEDEDPRVRGYAARALGALGAASAQPTLATLADDPAEVIDYDFAHSTLLTTTVGAMVKEAMGRH